MLKDYAMTNPEGNLTAAQYEIMEVVWAAGESGATVTEIWEAISQKREVTRTTVLNQVDRLERRGWLKRRKLQDMYHYVGVLDRDQTAQCLSQEFVADFFNGSASDLVMSLLGSKQLKRADIERLREVFESQLAKNEKKRN
jgi:predicted transcriptional regulator